MKRKDILLLVMLCSFFACKTSRLEKPDKIATVYPVKEPIISYDLTDSIGYINCNYFNKANFPCTIKCTDSIISFNRNLPYKMFDFQACMIEQAHYGDEKAIDFLDEYLKYKANYYPESFSGIHGKTRLLRGEKLFLRLVNMAKTIEATDNYGAVNMGIIFVLGPMVKRIGGVEVGTWIKKDFIERLARDPEYIKLVEEDPPYIYGRTIGLQLEYAYNSGLIELKDFGEE